MTYLFSHSNTKPRYTILAQLTLMGSRVLADIIIIIINGAIEITEKAFADIGKDSWKQACDHVEKMIDQTKATDLYKWEQDERFVIYVTGSDNSVTDTAKEVSSTDTASESEEFHWIDCIIWNVQLF